MPHKINVGIDVPLWLWIGDLMLSLSYMLCFLSLVASIWLIAFGVPLHWLAPVVFGILSLLLGVTSKPNPVAPAISKEVQHAEEENSD